MHVLLVDKSLGEEVANLRKKLLAPSEGKRIQRKIPVIMISLLLLCAARHHLRFL